VPRGDKLVAVAEFADRGVAEEAWTVLDAAGIPGSVITDPGPFGAAIIHRVEVARRDADAAQRLIAHLVTG
jgi:hypothetical protein